MAKDKRGGIQTVQVVVSNPPASASSGDLVVNCADHDWFGCGRFDSCQPLPNKETTDDGAANRCGVWFVQPN